MSHPYPNADPAFTAAAPAGVMPPSVKRAQVLVYVWVGLAVVNTLLTLVAKDALVDAYLDHINATGEFREFLADGAPAYTPIALISLVIFGGLLVLCALNFAKRANWARVVAFVFAGLAALGLPLQFVQPSPFWFKLVGILSGLVAIGIIVLLAQRDSSAWFSTRAA